MNFLSILTHDESKLMEAKDHDDLIAWTNRFLDLVGDASCHIHEVKSGP
jgi:hypothetical protein